VTAAPAGGGAPGRATSAVDLGALVAASAVEEVLRSIEEDLVGVAPVKARLREIAALLVVDRARREVGLTAGAPSLHMCFTGNPGTGKTTVALRMAEILHRLGYLAKGHVVAVTRDDLVGQWVGHTAPRTKAAVQKAKGGVLFIDEAYALHRPDNERDYGPEAVEILLQAMESQRGELVVIFAGYRERMDSFLSSNPGLASRVAHHVDFPDFRADELLAIAERLLCGMQYTLGPGAPEALAEYVSLRMRQPRFANARSIRNALDRARLRQAARLFAAAGVVEREALSRIEADDIRMSRVFTAEPSGPHPG
jgi:probable Rubsico expression protein CbbX